MNLGDLAIIYLTFGAPFAVQKYLRTRGSERGRRILASLFTLVFWIPTAARLLFRHLSNAYSKSGFVSRRNLDVVDTQLVETLENLRPMLIEAGCELSVHDVREVLDRYVGLTRARLGEAAPAARPVHIFEAARRKDYDLGSICLTRRNNAKLRRHCDEARKDFLALFEFLEGENTKTAQAFALGSEIALRLRDDGAYERLDSVSKKGKEPLIRDQQPRLSESIAPLIMSTAASSETK